MVTDSRTDSVLKHLGEPINPGQAKDIMEYFPLGEQVHYFPEYQKDLTMESVVLGYKINSHTVYSLNQLEIVSNSAGQGVITLYDGDQTHKIEHIEQFGLLVPCNAGEEYQLSYPDKASLGNTGQFRNGNAITLVARYQNRGVIMLETMVHEALAPKSGVYRGHMLACLNVLSTTLEFSEQRTHHRVTTNTPVTLQITEHGDIHACMLNNYSEVSVQITFNPEQALAQQLKSGQSATLTIKLGDLYKTFIIGTQVVRVNSNSAVLDLVEIIKNGEAQRFQLMDALAIKANLLQTVNPGLV